MTVASFGEKQGENLPLFRFQKQPNGRVPSGFQLTIVHFYTILGEKNTCICKKIFY